MAVCVDVHGFVLQDLEVSLKAWEEKQRSLGSHPKQLTLLADEELPVLAMLATTVRLTDCCFFWSTMLMTIFGTEYVW